jgi:cupin fold WbuC family metalloprotein
MNKSLTDDRSDLLTREAIASPRQRMNFNFHSELSDPIQRLAIAMEPATYIRPHRHRATWELLTPLRGRFVVLNFDDAGRVVERTVLGAGASVVEIADTSWHAVLSLDPGAIILEVKRGPYAPLAAEDFASWSPETEHCGGLMAWYREAQVGQRWHP